MIKLNLFFVFIFFNTSVFCQHIIPGEYDYGLIIAFDSINYKLTGYYKNSSGFDETTKKPKFECTFYFEGYANDSIIKINSFYPGEQNTDNISGKIIVTNKNAIDLHLNEEHGGCWDVAHFKGEGSSFNLKKSAKYQVIKYVISPKTFLYSKKTENAKLKSYLIEDDFVCIHKTEENWALCTYYGEKTITGWVKLTDLNK